MDLPIVEVIWTDSMTHSGWRDYEEAIDKETAKCKTVGYILGKDEETLIVVQSIAEVAEQVSEIICIPIVAVESIVELERVGGE